MTRPNKEAINFNRAKAAEMRWMYNHRCKEHGIRYSQHPGCFLKDEHKDERYGFFDIESYSYGKAFRAENSIVLSYYIKELDKDNFYHSVNTRKEILKLSDKEIMKQMIKDLSKFDVIFSYYGTRFDLCFTRTRALINKLEFFDFGELMHRDYFYVARSKLLLDRCNLESVTRVCTGSSNKTRFSPAIWARAFQGDKDCLKMIDEHCKWDVIDLESSYKVLKKYTRKNMRSI